MSKKVKDILIYPIKSLPPIRIERGYAKKRGLKIDRRWMLVDAEHKFITQRNHPILTQISIQLTPKQILLSYNNDSLSVPFKLKNHNTYQVEVWDHIVEAHEVSAQVNNWFTKILGIETKLVKMDKSSKRVKKFLRAPWKSKVSFADGYPYLIIGTASLELLNSKLEHPVNMDRFRGNIIADTDIAHEEDSWDTIIIGSAVFKLIKPCTRCKVITIDQQSGVSSAEPIKTLSTYRKFDNKINFGMNAICVEKGKFKKGDRIILMKN